MTPTECAALKARIDKLDAAIDERLSGDKVKSVGYGGRAVSFSESSVGDLRKRKGELERRYAKCKCSPALDTASLEGGRRAITPVFR